MCLKYMFANKRKTSAPPFHVKSTWQPPTKNSVALEDYSEETKLELASVVFRTPLDNISANERTAISSLKRNSEINLKKADKGRTAVIMDTTQTIEGLQQLSDDKFYKPLGTLIVLDTALNSQLDSLTRKWLTIDLKKNPAYQNFTRRQISTRKYRSAGQSFLVAVALRSVFLVSSTHYYKPSVKKWSNI